MRFWTAFSVLALVLGISSAVFAQDSSCEILFEKDRLPEITRAANRSSLKSFVDLAARYSWAVEKHPELIRYLAPQKVAAFIQRYWPEHYPSPTQIRNGETFAVASMPEILQRFDRLLEAVGNDRSRRSLQGKIEGALYEELEFRVPKKQIKGRISEFLSGGKGAWERGLGWLDLEDLQLLVHGGNPLKPTRDSLLGRYLAETGAASLVRSFPKGPDEDSAQGPKRLVVALSGRSLAAYEKYFANENFLVDLHTPNQGTLFLSHEGMVGTYAQMDRELRRPQVGSVLPHIMLDSFEAQRARWFFELGRVDQDTSLTPWELHGYCATGAYASCTHWFGNIPVGKKLVDSYAFPGMIDDHGDNSLFSNEARDRKPRIKKLKPYSNKDPLVRTVWTVPGHQQLADVLGLRRANLRAELANPGWVMISLTGSAPVDRVPFVFVVVGDHKRPLRKNFSTRHNAY